MQPESRHIVVVEDEPEVLDLLCEVIKEGGFRPVAVDAPDRALAETDVRPHLFLIDLMLPEMDGIALAQRLRADGHPDTPMIAMSASDRMLRRACHSGLFQDVLPKPFDVDMLLDMIAGHVN